MKLIKAKLNYVFTSIILLLFLLSGCITYNTASQRMQKREYGFKKNEPLIRLLLFKVERNKIYHISTKSSFVYIKPKINGGKNNFANSSKVIVKSGEFYIKVNENSAIIGDKSFILPCRIENLSKFKLNDVDLVGNLILYRDFIVLEMPIENYIEGVIASEVGVNWPIEALKAQAVVSRTYAVYSIINSSDRPYDLGISELHQKYRVAKGFENIRRAVESTKGIIIYYHSKPIQAFFHSCSGGITESGGNVFSKDLPYLKSIRDPYSLECPDKNWEVELTSEDIIRRLDKRVPAKLRTKEITDIKIGAKTSSGRVKFFIVSFGQIGYNIKGNDFRLAMGPKVFKSLLITGIFKKHGNIYEFVGKGYGHGVGMSQWGAKNMALHGFSYTSIIKFYYRGVNLNTYNKLPIFDR